MGFGYIEREMTFRYKANYGFIRGVKEINLKEATSSPIIGINGTPCGHASNIVDDVDAYSITLAGGMLLIDVCESCYSELEDLYTKGSNPKWEAEIAEHYNLKNLFSMSDHIWFGTMFDLQIYLNSIHKAKEFQKKKK